MFPQIIWRKEKSAQISYRNTFILYYFLQLLRHTLLVTFLNTKSSSNQDKWVKSILWLLGPYMLTIGKLFKVIHFVFKCFIINNSCSLTDKSPCRPPGLSQHSHFRPDGNVRHCPFLESAAKEKKGVCKKTKKQS